jgi:hypothetical protein
MLESILTNRALWEQPLLDLWSVPHFLSGVFIAITFIALRRNLVLGIAVGGLIAVLWEVFEHVTGISTVETGSNIIIDVLVLLVGFAIVLPLRPYIPDGHHRWVIRALVAAYIGVIFLGWLSYQYYAFA